jgi:glutamine amidotransferase
LIVVLDYGLGNLRSVEKALEHLGFPTKVTNSPEDLPQAQALVLPGVGAFDDCIKDLESTGLKEALLDFISTERPVLGICLGLQLLFTQSEEGILPGLDFIPGQVVKLPDSVKIPQMGWNQVTLREESGLLKNIPDRSYFYFAHSYYVAPEDNQGIVATTDYGLTFPSVFEQENLFGVQFHPEKSGHWGLEVLKNFGRLV